MLMNYSRFALKPVLRVATPPQLGSPAMVWQRSRLWLSSARRQRRLVSSGVVRRRRSGDDYLGSDSEDESGYQTCPLHDHV